MNLPMDCHASPSANTGKETDLTVALIGHPNVGKSVLFHQLTGKHVAVSNYPGTTVEISRGAMKALPQVGLVDTPGLVGFPAHTEDEQITAKLLLTETFKAVVQVGDSKNLRRTLNLTIQLVEMGVPLVLALNLTDEAKVYGVSVDALKTAECLDLPVIATVAVQGKGIPQVIEGIQKARQTHFRLDYPEDIEAALEEIISHLPLASPISTRSLAVLFLSEDRIVEGWLEPQLSPAAYHTIAGIRENLSNGADRHIPGLIQKTRQEFVETIVGKIQQVADSQKSPWKDRLERMTTHPFWSFPIFAMVLYALYWFVGIFGAGTLVGLFEEQLFGQILNPWIAGLVNRLIPLALLRDFFIGEYGLWTMGLTYALALILPIVATFFLAFSFLEDTGYLPRMAGLSNRFFAVLGLNGKAVLPMVLGLGCVTMATVTTRVLESRRDRFLVTLLLALGIPCSAQLGVVMGMLAGISITATLIWGAVVLAVLFVVGWLASKLVPGERTYLLTELPPLRWPQFSNLAAKTTARLEWYIKEVVPLFLIGTALLFIFDRSGLLALVINLSKPVVGGWLGLPLETSSAFLIGFLRRDFAATNLFVLQRSGLLTPPQALVSMVTITLFIPCIASVMMIARERGWRTSLGMIAFIIPLAVLVGGLLQRALLWINWSG